MSVADSFPPRPSDPIDRRQRATGLGGVAMLGGLALGMTSQVPAPVAVGLAAAGVIAAATLLAPPAVRALSRNRGLGLVVALVGLGALWVVSGVRHANGPSQSLFGPFSPSGVPYPFVPEPYYLIGTPSSDWPWRVGRLSLLPLALMLFCAAGGLVLLADAVRVQLGLAPLAPAQRAPWRLMTSPPERRSRVAWRMVPGVLLVGLAAFLAIGLADRYVAGDALLQAIALIGVGGWAAFLIASPLLVGSLMRVDRDKAGRAREEERQRFAAHLHDSVLQTLALVQRQAHDPAAVIRVARRQEHALRAWMAGDAELVSETLAAALREVVAEVEDEYRITVELTAIGDRALDTKGEALVAAAREALRNAARHAPGAPVFMFCEVARERAEVFVRDEGPGFDPEAVATERRGIRDAMIGRMAVCGGRATIESTLGEGTEVALLLGPAAGR
jgi:signal transduction histidine kinase